MPVDEKEQVKLSDLEEREIIELCRSNGDAKEPCCFSGVVTKLRFWGRSTLPFCRMVAKYWSGRQGRLSALKFILSDGAGKKNAGDEPAENPSPNINC